MRGADEHRYLLAPPCKAGMQDRVVVDEFHPKRVRSIPVCRRVPFRSCEVDVDLVVVGRGGSKDDREQDPSHRVLPFPGPGRGPRWLPFQQELGPFSVNATRVASHSTEHIIAIGHSGI